MVNIKAEFTHFLKTQAIWFKKKKSWSDHHIEFEFIITYLWGFWVLLSCIHIPLFEEIHQGSQCCVFAPWLGKQGNTPSNRLLCRWCKRAPAGSRRLWSTADIDPMGNHNICTLGNEDMHTTFENYGFEWCLTRRRLPYTPEMTSWLKAIA